jgi:glycosyltransferase involved in cell wall biosynthesis
MLVPSEGLGGGIERYIVSIREGLVRLGHEVEMVSLRAKTPANRAKSWVRATRSFRKRRGTDDLVFVMHHRLLPILWASGRSRGRSVVFFYGQDIWGLTSFRSFLIRRSGALHCTISSFSAGAMVRVGIDHVIAPTLSVTSASMLEEQARLRASRDVGDTLEVLTVFRLGAARSKGLSAILDAIAVLRSRGVDARLTIAGSGNAGDIGTDLSQGVRVVANPTDEELAALYGAADVFVLATGVSRGDSQTAAHGEGFGQVVVEAQAAGTPVCVRSIGGQSDTFVANVTGIGWESDDPSDLADAIIDAIRLDPLDPVGISSLAMRRFGPGSADPSLASLVRKLGQG